MFLNQTLSLGRRAGLTVGVAGMTLLSACSLFRGEPEPAAATVPPPAATAAAATPVDAGPQTVTEALGELQEGETATIVNAGPALNPSAPKSYVVQRGDTLWGLANMFLRDPFLWPEIWYVNPQVQNPHRIYPGDTLQLASGSDGSTQIQLTRGPAARLQPLLRSASLGDNGPIGTIPYDAIHAFLSKPGVLSRDEAKRAPYVLGIRNGHLIAGINHDLYIKKLTANVGERYHVMHVDVPLRDPENGNMLGHMAVYSGTVQVTRTGDPATANVSESEREILAGDVLVPETTLDIANIVPHAPTAPMDGRVMAVVNSVLLVGQYQIVAINRGVQHGVEVGHVLKVLEAGKRVKDRCVRINGTGTCNSWGTEQLPNEMAGSILVFKTLDQLSYALVLSEVNPIHIADHIVNP